MAIEKYIINKSDLIKLLRGEDLPIQPMGNIKGFSVEITGDLTNGDIPVLCVVESNIFSNAVIKTFTGEKAERLYKELTGQNVIIKVESENEK